MTPQQMVPLDVMARSPKTYRECEQAAVDAIPVADMRERKLCPSCEVAWEPDDADTYCPECIGDPLLRLQDHRCKLRRVLIADHPDDPPRTL